MALKITVTGRMAEAILKLMPFTDCPVCDVPLAEHKEIYVNYPYTDDVTIVRCDRKPRGKRK